ncbi:MAG: hypothetical protein ACMUHY_04460, partial [Thermoplasmatota archaeon]
MVTGNGTGPEEVGGPTETGQVSGPANPGTGSGYFTENLGQWKGDFRFSALTDFGITYLLEDGVVHQTASTGGSVMITFQRSLPSEPQGKDDTGFPTNFFIGSDPDNWLTGARSFERVIYRDVWSNIDIEYYFRGSALKYDIIVHPG